MQKSDKKTDKKNLDAPIGIFDSGVGGLTVAKEVMRQLPNEKIVYFELLKNLSAPDLLESVDAEVLFVK